MVFLLIALFAVASLTLLAIDGDDTDIWAFVMAGCIVAVLAAEYILFPVLFRHGDRSLLLIINTLAVLGLVFQYRLDPWTAFRQLAWFIVGLTVMGGVVWFLSRWEGFEAGSWLYMGMGLALLAASLVYGSTAGGAKSWVRISEVLSIQPSEFAKVTLCLSLASVLREQRRFTGYLPLFAFILLSVALLVVQKDLGAAALYYITFLGVLMAATSNGWWVSAGVLGAAGGAVAAYHFFDHVRLRVSVWLDPWSLPDTGGYQIIQGLEAVARGGLLGAGLGQGFPTRIPAVRNDYIFAAVCEELGIAAGIIVIAFYLILVVRGAFIARAARDSFRSLLAASATLMIAAQSFIIIGGVLRMIPLTGITLPLVSYGGSSMLGTLMLCGILQAIAQRNGIDRQSARQAKAKRVTQGEGP
ncbi:MAG: FtsW/RodA/SpoVE family cell cycle protein [Clostridiales bacterium]|nr:FtsW/RodA/SpoVE family cell cycle protein [Clostridiales bacterium]